MVLNGSQEHIQLVESVSSIETQGRLSHNVILLAHTPHLSLLGCVNVTFILIQNGMMIVQLWSLPSGNCTWRAFNICCIDSIAIK